MSGAMMESTTNHQPHDAPRVRRSDAASGAAEA